MILFLTRTYFPEGTNGVLRFEGKIICETIELPWKNNLTGLSCIPEGKYVLRKRFSLKYNWHIELVNVSHRRLILIHPANYALKELKDCIALVLKISGPGIGIHSKKATKKLQEIVFKALERNEKVELIIE